MNLHDTMEHQKIEVGLTTDMLIKKMGINPQTYYTRQREDRFTRTDLVKIFKYLKFSDEQIAGVMK